MRTKGRQNIHSFVTIKFVEMFLELVVNPIAKSTELIVGVV